MYVSKLIPRKPDSRSLESPAVAVESHSFIPSRSICSLSLSSDPCFFWLQCKALSKVSLSRRVTSEAAIVVEKKRGREREKEKKMIKHREKNSSFMHHKSKDPLYNTLFHSNSSRRQLETKMGMESWICLKRETETENMERKLGSSGKKERDRLSRGNEAGGTSCVTRAFNFVPFSSRSPISSSATGHFY